MGGIVQKTPVPLNRCKWAKKKAPTGANIVGAGEGT